MQIHQVRDNAREPLGPGIVEAGHHFWLYDPIHQLLFLIPAHTPWLIRHPVWAYRPDDVIIGTGDAAATEDGANEDPIYILHYKLGEILDASGRGYKMRTAVSVTTGASQTLTMFNPFRFWVCRPHRITSTAIAIKTIYKREYIPTRITIWTTKDAEISRTFKQHFMNPAGDAYDAYTISTVSNDKTIDTVGECDKVTIDFTTAEPSAQTETVDVMFTPLLGHGIGLGSAGGEGSIVGLPGGGAPGVFA